MNETEPILHQIAEATGQTSERVEQVVSALRDSIDGLFLDGYTIYAPPFTLTYRTDPVAPIFAERVERASSEEIEAWHQGDVEATAQWLDVPLSVYRRHPVASDLRVLIELLDALDIEDADSPAGSDAVAVAEAWFDTFREERPYRLGNVGLERDLEAWLIHHTERLVQIGYDVRLRQQQFVLPDRRRPDLVFDLTEDDGAPGTLIVELKATNAYLRAVDQLVGYLDAFVSLGIAEGVVRGLLVADGVPPEVLAYAEEKGIDTATLTELGYRRDLAALTTTKPSDPARATDPENRMKTFILYSYSLQTEEPTPVLYVDATDLGSLPSDVRPFDPDDPTQNDEAESLRSRLSEPEASSWATIGRLAVSYGGITDADGNPVDTAPIRNLESKHFDAIDAADDYAFPWEASVRATEAAAEFLRAVWELRKDITVVPPRHLATYLQSNPDELQGDDDLPEHIETAADAVEDLPRAVIDWAAPAQYDGGVESFLLDAERLFLSVSRRLRRLQSESVSTA